MELRTLRYLVEIAEEKSINRAAEKLYVSQPTLSRAIQALERELGFAVLERTNHGVSLTTLGERFYYYAKSVVGQLEAIEKLRADRQEDTRSRLSVSVAKLILKDDMMLQYRTALSAAHAELILLETTQEEAVLNVASLRSEIGVITANSLQLQAIRRLLEIKELELELLAECPLCVHLSADHPLAAQKEIAPRDMLDCVYMHLPYDYFANLNYMNQMDGVQLSDFKRTITINNYHAMINMLKHTDAFIFGNRWQADELRKGSVATLPLEGVDIAVSLFWVKRKKELLSAEALCFLDLLRKNYGFM
ncbi:LysR family transcriptional regulator [Allofournierella sp.]|uniref:LysR family transcriptional regulator n=1 Tax=Allofournierella sp. TaxID=1940256 RepID=UPI003AB1D4B2